MNLYLVRHAPFIRNGGMKDDYFYRISEEGVQIAKNAAQFVRENCFDEGSTNDLVSSNTLRTIETTIPFSQELRLPIRIIDGIHEISLGDNENKPKSDWVYTLEDGTVTDRKDCTIEERFRIRHLNGESPYDVYMRMRTLLDYVKQKDMENYYIIGHGTTLRLFTMLVTQEKEQWYYDEPIPENCSVRKLVLQKGHCVYNKFIH